MGLDVHAAKVVAAITDQQSGELAVRKMGGATGQVAEFCAELPTPVRVAYEAGPTGFAEVGDFHRFERPAQLMSYLGLVPSETARASAGGRARSRSP